MTDFISYAIGGAYVMLVARLFIGWKRAERFRFQPGAARQQERVSVVVTLGGAARHLPDLLHCLGKQTYKNLEIVLVDDSGDGIRAQLPENAKLLTINKKERKNALRAGVEAAGGELILCTGADCLPCPTWAECAATFLREAQADLVLAPAVMMAERGATEKMQALEFMSRQAALAGAAGVEKPILRSEANLAFAKSAWTECAENAKCDDRIFDNFYRTGKSVQFLKSQSATVFVRPEAAQSSRTKAFRNVHAVGAAAASLAVCAAILGNGAAAVFDAEKLFPFGILFISKLLADRVLLSSYSIFSREQHLTIWIFPASLIYPFYALASAVARIFSRKK